MARRYQILWFIKLDESITCGTWACQYLIIIPRAAQGQCLLRFLSKEKNLCLGILGWEISTYFHGSFECALIKCEYVWSKRKLQISSTHSRWISELNNVVHELPLPKQGNRLKFYSKDLSDNNNLEIINYSNDGKFSVKAYYYGRKFDFIGKKIINSFAGYLVKQIKIWTVAFSD